MEAGFQLLSGKPSANILRLGLISFGAPKVIKNGVIAVVTLKIKPDAKHGSANILLKPEAADSAGNMLDVNWANGLITVRAH